MRDQQPDHLAALGADLGRQLRKGAVQTPDRLAPRRRGEALLDHDLVQRRVGHRLGAEAGVPGWSGAGAAVLAFPLASFLPRHRPAGLAPVAAATGAPAERVG
ncbi:hypothetical protein ACFY8B_03310 [Streptomyces sp. NPDC012751]|uniref:hypothetical protein n=1 Tax=Streptomyces sp. NPDC012751 TaxID=3364846 RepID=UPI0036B4FCE6